MPPRCYFFVHVSGFMMLVYERTKSERDFREKAGQDVRSPERRPSGVGRVIVSHFRQEIMLVINTRIKVSADHFQFLRVQMQRSTRSLFVPPHSRRLPRLISRPAALPKEAYCLAGFFRNFLTREEKFTVGFSVGSSQRFFPPWHAAIL